MLRCQEWTGPGEQVARRSTVGVDQPILDNRGVYSVFGGSRDGQASRKRIRDPKFPSVALEKLTKVLLSVIVIHHQFAYFFKYATCKQNDTQVVEWVSGGYRPALNFGKVKETYDQKDKTNYGCISLFFSFSYLLVGVYFEF